MRYWNGEYITYPIAGHVVLSSFILLGINGYSCTYFPINTVKYNRAYVISGFILFLNIIVDVLCTELTFMDMT